MRPNCHELLPHLVPDPEVLVLDELWPWVSSLGSLLGHEGVDVAQDDDGDHQQGKLLPLLPAGVWKERNNAEV